MLRATWLAVLPLCACLASNAQVSPPSRGASAAAVNATRIVHEFAYRVDDSSDTTVLDKTYPFTLTVSHTGPAQRNIQSFTVQPVGDTARYFKETECTPSGFSTGQGSVMLTCVMKSNEQTSFWQRVLARTKAYPVRATPEFLSGAGPGETMSSPFFHVRIQAGLLPVCIGGFAGAFLFAVFRILTRYLTRAGADECVTEWRPALRAVPATALCALHQVFDAFIFAARGFLVALIFIFLAQALGTTDLPLSVRVEDFYGGVIVGLLSLSIGRWIGDKLGLGGRSVGGSAHPPAPAPAPPVDPPRASGPDPAAKPSAPPA